MPARAGPGSGSSGKRATQGVLAEAGSGAAGCADCAAIAGTVPATRRAPRSSARDIDPIVAYPSTASTPSRPRVAESLRSKLATVSRAGACSTGFSRKSLASPSNRSPLVLTSIVLREFEQLVGRSSTLAAVVEALADGPLRLGELATKIGSPTGAAVRYLERLGDAVLRKEDRYRLDDPVFALWVRWKKPGGTVVPMSVLDAELEVAKRLAEMGFELVYQSRASRGAFDLLAMRGGGQLGVQVKRTSLPVRLKKMEHNRMRADAQRFGWRFVLAVVTPEPEHVVVFLDPERARAGRLLTLSEEASIDNLLAWLSS
jgi:Holliday junction resolvase